jgi:hypothetical protein
VFPPLATAKVKPVVITEAEADAHRPAVARTIASLDKQFFMFMEISLKNANSHSTKASSDLWFNLPDHEQEQAFIVPQCMKLT